MVSDSGIWVRAEICEEMGGEGSCVLSRGGLHRAEGAECGEDSDIDGTCVR